MKVIICDVCGSQISRGGTMNSEDSNSLKFRRNEERHDFEDICKECASVLHEEIDKTLKLLGHDGIKEKKSIKIPRYDAQ